MSSERLKFLRRSGPTSLRVWVNGLLAQERRFFHVWGMDSEI